MSNDLQDMVCGLFHRHGPYCDSTITAGLWFPWHFTPVAWIWLSDNLLCIYWSFTAMAAKLSQSADAGCVVCRDFIDLDCDADSCCWHRCQGCFEFDIWISHLFRGADQTQLVLDCLHCCSFCPDFVDGQLPGSRPNVRHFGITFRGFWHALFVHPGWQMVAVWQHHVEEGLAKEGHGVRSCFFLASGVLWCSCGSWWIPEVHGRFHQAQWLTAPQQQHCTWCQWTRGKVFSGAFWRGRSATHCWALCQVHLRRCTDHDNQCGHARLRPESYQSWAFTCAVQKSFQWKVLFDWCSGGAE